MAVVAAVVDELEGLHPHVGEWDRLAVLRGQPYSAPAWMLAWWRNVAPRGSRLAVTVVRDEAAVIGIGAWCRYRTRAGLRVARLMGSGHRVEPLSEPGREREVAGAMAEALRSMAGPPGALLLDRADLHSPWPELLNDVWAHRTASPHRDPLTAPTLVMAGRTHAQYLAGRSGSFRSQRKRMRRKFADRGVQARLVDGGDDLDTVVRDVMRLHDARWQSRGQTSGLLHGMAQMLRESAHELVPAGRMRIWLLEADGVPISAQVFLVAGGDTAYWNGGFDPAWSELRPGFETVAIAVEHSFEVGDRRFDFGGGANHYKTRLAEGDEPLASSMLVAGGAGGPVRAAQLLPDRVGRAVVRLAKNLPPPVQLKLRSARAVVSGRGR